MAEKKLNTRILLKTDTLENWEKSTLGLKKGELAIATVAATDENGLTEPVTMIKIGEDGVKTFKDLPWALHAKASDVLAACKSEAGLKSFVNSVIAEAGIATDEAMQELAGKVTTAEGKITTLEGKMTTVEGKASANESAIKALQELVGDGKVADQISAAIAAQELDKKYDAIGSAAAVQTELNTYKTSNDAAVKKVSDDLAAEVARAGVAEKANADAIEAILKDAAEIDSFADVETALAGKEAAGEAAKAEAAAKAYADGLAGNYDAKGSAATAEQNAKDYADGLAGNYDAAGSAEAAQSAAKDYTDGRISAMVGDKSVQAQIADLKLSENYDAKGAAAAAESAAKSHADGLNTAMNTRVEALEAIDHEHANAAELAKIADGDVAKWNAAEQNAKDYADGLDEAMAERVKTLEDKFTGDDSVADQIADAVAAEAELREAADSDLQDAIDALEELVGDTKVETQIATAVAAEKERAEGIEGGLRTDVDAIKEDYLNSDDKQDLQDQIDLIMDNPDTANVIDSINEFTTYITTHGEIAEGFRTDIDANEAAIGAVRGRVDTAEGEIDALQEAIATKAAQADLETLAGRVTTAEGEIDTLQSDLDTAEEAIEALEGLVGDTAVETQINAAIEALKIGDYAKAADLTAAINQHNTDKAALEAEIAKKANDADLAAIAKSGNVNDLIQTEGDVLIFDCGTSV